MTQHTPGPWTRHPMSDLGGGKWIPSPTSPGGRFYAESIIIGHGETMIGEVRLQRHEGGIRHGFPVVTDEAELQANFAVVTAAPVMLAALQRVERVLADDGPSALLLAVRDAIAAATVLELTEVAA